MMDGSLRDDMKTPASYAYNIEVTHKVAEMAHAVGVSVEGELGCLGSLESGMAAEEDGSGAQGKLSHDQLLTDPEQCADFVDRTGVDALAIAIGTSHGAYKFSRKPTADILAIDRIREIHQRIPDTHLVMHGSSSVPQEWLTIIRAHGGALEETWGVPVEQILDLAGVTTGKQLKGENLTKYLLVKCADGYEVLFSLAELVRRQRGGTAIVMGALSPRARNAQVGMFQAGEVDYLVATDAIGMGLNMDLDHVAFARLGKFDGSGPRRLSAAEIGQIAGRAGRHMSDGTFGTTAEEGPLDQAIVTAVEEHRFDALTRLSWRNTKLRFQSVGALLKSLDERPPVGGLIQTRDADDHRALQLLAHHREVMGLATHPGAVRLLWEVCQIPDFRKVMSDSHARFLAHCFVQLAGPEGRLPGPWIGAQMAQLDRLDGDIDTLMTRIAHVRTWTYITHRGDWVDSPAEWQERARGIEDRLSDALHDRITQRFVDRRSAFLVRQMAGDGELLASVDKAGAVLVEGAHVGRLDGFRFVPDASEGAAMRTLLTAANRVLRTEVAAHAGATKRIEDAASAALPVQHSERDHGAGAAAAGAAGRGDAVPP